MFLSLLQRLFMSVITFVGVLLITFFLLHIVPGGPFDQERKISPESEKNLYQHYGLHKRGDQAFTPWFFEETITYARYLMQGKLGPSLKYRGRDVSEIIHTAFLPSLELGLSAMILAILGSIFMGLACAWKPYKLIDQIISFTSSFFLSLPSFVLAVTLILLFSQKLSLFPPALWEGQTYKVLPILTLALVPLFTFTQMIRHEVLAEMKKDYVRTALAKGLSVKSAIVKHAFPNALSPFLSLLGPVFSHIITGSFVVETLFSVPGLGKHFITAVIDRDYFLVMGIVGVYTFILITVNWIIDWTYGFFDPRMRTL
jgi:oligopeptide transport system permease protein